MLKKRLIAVILVRDGRVVQSVKFKHTNVIHYDAIHAIESFNRWAIDEIVILNVSKTKESQEEFLKIIQKISTECFVPLAAGGWINHLNYGKLLLKSGADKLVVNTQLYHNPELIKQLIAKFGSQCIVASIDAKKDEEGNEKVMINRGQDNTGKDVLEWVKEVEQIGVGEIFLNSMDHDGNRKGYNIPLIKKSVEAVNIPVIAMGGVLTWNHMIQGVLETDAAAVAAANIFHYTEHSTKKAKRALLNKNLNFRKL